MYSWYMYYNVLQVYVLIYCRHLYLCTEYICTNVLHLYVLMYCRYIYYLLQVYVPVHDGTPRRHELGPGVLLPLRVHDGNLTTDFSLGFQLVDIR